jgi:allophanate hydrolase
VPAGLNNIVGLKPSLGLVSTAGIVPACRSLDCVSILALTTDDAWTALSAVAGFDTTDPYSRDRPFGSLGSFARGVRVGVPFMGQRIFFADDLSAKAYDAAIARCAARGAQIIEIDIEPFYETARLLYEGPWIAERYLSVRALLASAPDSMHPVTKEIILQGARPSAVDAFAAFHKLEALRRVCDHLFQEIDVLFLPTIPTVYTVEQVLADPIRLNTRLGTYTNFVNLLDLCGLAVPSSMREDGAPFGVTLLAPGGHDALLASIGRVLHADSMLPLGALDVPQPSIEPPSASLSAEEIAIAIVGAHLSGMPLSGELKAERARFLETTSTAPDYRLYALPGEVQKPALLRVTKGEGVPIEVEIWAMTADGFGRFVAAAPPPLSIGTLSLADGRRIKGFLVEAQAVVGERDISVLAAGGRMSHVNPCPLLPES